MGVFKFVQEIAAAMLCHVAFHFVDGLVVG
jgi:hypothetical protein